jgi:hypothetical protein
MEVGEADEIKIGGQDCEAVRFGELPNRLVGCFRQTGQPI